MAHTGTCLTISILYLISAAAAQRELRASRGPPFQFSVDQHGMYSLQQGRTTWLQSAPTFLYTDGKRYSTEDGTLKLTKNFTTSGRDKIGSWNSNCFLFTTGIRSFQTCIKTWTNVPAVVFQQVFVNGTSSSSTGNPDHVISAFPAFQIPTQDEGLAFLSYQGSMFGGSPKIGRWNVANTTGISGGVVGGPVALYDQQGSVAIIAPFSEFMSASRSRDELHRLNWGVMGAVASVPKAFQSEFLIYYGRSGINKIFDEWGQVMRFYYNKDENYRKADMTNNYLGYWTDNGAYYYYHTETNRTYEKTILDIYNDAKSLGINYRYVQYDSWFYPKDNFGGVLSWSSMSSIAPDGLQYVYNITKWPVHAHNRWWSPKTPYAKQNGGQYNFIVEKEKAIPQDLDFWLFLFKQARLWGLVVYEQDWLDNEFRGLNSTLSTVDVARTWLLQMGEAARATGLTIQYCMSNPRHAMQSLEIPVVTQARVSGDYHPGSDQWEIGVTSIFAEAMGVAPFKDCFWTVQNEPGNPYHGSEPNGELQTAVSTLSTGPVGPADMVHLTDKNILMQCCRSDGMILQPDKPALAIDKQIWQSAWGGTLGPRGQVWTTYTSINTYWHFGIVLAAALSSDYKLTPTDAGFQEMNNTVVMTRSKPSLNINPTIQNFGENFPIFISQNCSRKNFCMFYTSPVFHVSGNEVVLYGEAGKFVPISRKRIENLEITSDDIKVTLLGPAGEVVNFGVFVNRVYHRSSCTIAPSGTSVLSVLTSACRNL